MKERDRKGAGYRARFFVGVSLVALLTGTLPSCVEPPGADARETSSSRNPSERQAPRELPAASRSPYPRETSAQAVALGTTRTPTSSQETVQQSPLPEVVADSTPAYSAPAPKSPLALVPPGAARAAVSKDRSLADLWREAESAGMAAQWRKAGERALSLGLYSQAAGAFRKEAAIYRSKGILQAALAQEARAAQYSTEISLYVSEPAKNSGPGKERLEPSSGCYVGAFIDRDDNLEKMMFASQTHGDVDEFTRLVGKEHASFFMYRTYGQPFPRKWAEYLKERGAIVHIAWEPRSLADVRDDAYLREFVDQMVELDSPVMLRFASEMNGEWTPYHGDPKAYKAAFRLVYKATRRAPKVAMMWCPNTVPRQGVESYYPGDDAVDWVGVNFYSVPFLDNDRGRPGERIQPTDHLQAIYDLYSARKPIAIGEWAAARQSSVVPRPTTEFAVTKTAQLYSALPTRYPRVKMVNWYDSNNMREAKPGRQLNNFQLTEPAAVLDEYRKAVESPYYLGARATASPFVYKRVFGRSAIVRDGVLRVALKSYEQRPKVYFKVNGAFVLATNEALDWWVAPKFWKRGKNVVEVFVFDSKDRFVTRAKAVLDLDS